MKCEKIQIMEKHCTRKGMDCINVTVDGHGTVHSVIYHGAIALTCGNVPLCYTGIQWSSPCSSSNGPGAWRVIGNNGPLINLDCNIKGQYSTASHSFHQSPQLL